MANNGWKERIKQLFAGMVNENNRKLVWRITILGVIGFLLLVSGKLIDSNPSQMISQNESETEAKQTISSQQLDTEAEMERKLAKILSDISGVGRVRVDITLDTGSEYEYARDYNTSQKTTDQQDSNGGQQKTEQVDKQRELVIVRTDTGKEEAVIKKETKPKVRGVMVVAEGAEVSQVKAELISAVKVGLGVRAHRIVVLPMKR
ncbi:sporulation stage III protein AG [Acetohalobium arabaticum]|uniref:Sporulation stage III protein AG n=1 Tax=Acetohalobium arabaticum (strain ATCC 49924 / DSM 5501 / Z-7288) TaxID=574087 RepID=D9QRW0_ACEAZ|nr:sporulation stage III protein AG [Acetohalobium arabaticum]ADL13251.1 sporulation stage III protein AG [Acetohalobium arabaticum DSM 5501]